MGKVFWISFVFVFQFCFSLCAQNINMDTILLNGNHAATLCFEEDEEVLLCNIGGNPFKIVGEFTDYKYYQISIMGNMVLLEKKQDKLEYSSIMVKTSKRAYYGIIGLASDDEIKTSFYEFQEKISAVTPAVSKKTSSNSEEYDDDEDNFIHDNGVEIFMNYNNDVTEEQMFERLNQVTSMPNEFEDIADMKGEVIFQVANIVNDHKYSYIKLIIQNNSSTTYTINGVFFRFQESKKSTVGKKDAQNVEWLNAERIKMPDNRSVNAYSYDVVGFIIPLYNGSTGNVMLKVIEDQGTRTAVLSIKSKTVNSCKVF